MSKLLSLCITTFNRSRYLDCCLGSIFQQLRNENLIDCVEIVVSDDCSGDDTSAVIEKYKNILDIKYYSNLVNVGYEVNIGSVISLAKGRYTLYLSDDDLLDMREVFAVLCYMDQHYDVSVVYAPSRLIDLSNNIDYGTFYSIDDLTEIPKEAYVEALDLVLDKHIFPEVGIFRNYPEKKMAVSIENGAWYAFVHLRNMLAVGKVIFWPQSFYAAILNYFPDLSHGHEGNKDTMYKWDTYRGGVEVLLAAARVDSGLMPFYALKISRFTAIRMSVGLRLRLAAMVGNAVENYYLAARVAAYGIGLPICGKDISTMAKLDYIAQSRQIHNHRKGLYVVNCMDAALAEELSRLNPCSWFVSASEFDCVRPDNVVVLLMNNASVCWRGEGNCYLSEDDLEIMFPEI